MSAGILWRRFTRDGAALAALGVLVVLALMAAVGPFAVDTDPAHQELALRRSPPSLENPFGRDHLGRDVLSRIVHGAQFTMLSGLAATGLVTVAGLLFGLVAGYYGRWIDQLVMRMADLMLAFPFFLAAIVIVAILGPNLLNAILAVAIAKAPMFARVVRGSVLQAREMTYTEAARAIGCPDRRIILRHILPNVVMPIMVLSTVEMAAMILSLSGLSFLGLGVQPPASEWGLMLNEARGYLGTAPHTMLFPGLFLALLVLAINLVGDGLRYATDPRMRLA